MSSAAQKMVAFDPPHRARAKSTLAAQVETRGFPFPGLTFVRDELRTVEGKRNRQRFRNFWSVGKDGTYREGRAAGQRHALELLTALQREPTGRNAAMLGIAMAEAQDRGGSVTEFERGVIVGFCRTLSYALILGQASIDDLRAYLDAYEAEYQQALATLESR